MSVASRRLSFSAVTCGAAALLLAALVLTAPGASADSRPTNPSNPATPPTVSADALPTVQVDGVVWSQAVVGNTVYAAGSFTSARPAGVQRGTGETPRANLLAYDIRTGALNTSWVPQTNGQVLTIKASADGTRLYLGGQFDRVNGEVRSRIAAVDASTGALVSSFRPLAQTTVRALVVTADTVYFGGDFTKVNSIARGYVAAAATSNGALLPWSPAANAPVTAMTFTPDRSKLVLGGRFTTVAGSSQYGMSAVSPSTGAVQTWLATQVVRNAGTPASITSLSADDDSVYGTGYVFGAGGNLEGAFRARPSDGAITWLQDCHGDSYDSHSRAGVVYVVGHPHNCQNIGGYPETNPRTWRHALAFSKSATGVVRPNTQGGYANFAGQPAPSLQNWFPVLGIGTVTGQSQAAWSVEGNSDYLVLAGEFPTVDGKIQQGLVRMRDASAAPNKVAPVLTSDLTPRLSATGTTVQATFRSSYDLDNTTLTYRLYRNGAVVKTLTGDSVYWNRPTLSTTDTGLARSTTYRYKVSASDPFGNTVTSPEVSVRTGVL